MAVTYTHLTPVTCTVAIIDMSTAAIIDVTTIAASSSSSRSHHERRAAVAGSAGGPSPLRLPPLQPLAVPLIALGPPPPPRPSIVAALGSSCAHLAPATTRGFGAPAPRRAYVHCSPQQRSPPSSFICARLLLHVPPTLVPLLGTLHEHAAPPSSAYTAAPSAHVVVITVAAPLVDHRR